MIHEHATANIEEPGKVLAALSQAMRSVPRDLTTFRQANKNWWRARDFTRPVYCLPKAAIDTLSKPSGKSLAFFNLEDSKSEIAFTDLCRSQHAIGVWGDDFVNYPLLQEHIPPPSPELIASLPFAMPPLAEVNHLVKLTEERSVRLKGTVGRLVTEPAFLKQTTELQEKWQLLPASERPGFPLERSIGLDRAPDGAEWVSVQTSAFATCLRNFLDRWGLTRLVTWDLPEPQGPLLPNPLPPSAAATPQHGIHIFLPLHYGVQKNDDLIHQIREFQRAAVKQLGIDESFAGITQFRKYAGMLEVLHLERVIVSRITKGSRLKARVLRIESAIAEALGMATDSVRRHRKFIAKCLKGKRTKNPPA